MSPFLLCCPACQPNHTIIYSSLQGGPNFYFPASHICALPQSCIISHMRSHSMHLFCPYTKNSSIKRIHLRPPYPYTKQQTHNYRAYNWTSKLKNKDHHCIHSLHHTDDCSLVASALMSAGAPMRKGVHQLNCPKIPSHRRLADELPCLPSTNRQMNPTHDNHHWKTCTTWNSTPGMEYNTHQRYH